MKFETLKDRMEYFRSLTDYKLMPNSYVIVMIDGRGFSKSIKRLFEKPFDDKFIDMMNNTAKYVCEHVQGVKTAFVQSDEISFVLNDFDTPETDSFFGYRLCKMQSVIAGMASTVFNDLYIENLLYIPASSDDVRQMIIQKPKFHFDCKAWNVPTLNDAYAWLLYRQNDCIRNSKQQAAQTYLPKKSLIGKNTDEQIQMLFNEKQIDWSAYDNGKKYGRVLYKEKIVKETPNGECERNIWTVNFARPFEENKNLMLEIINGQKENTTAD